MAHRVLLFGPAMEFVEVARVSQFPEGSFRAIAVGDQTIVLYRTRDGFFATESRCPHRGGPLAEGDIIGDEIVCPWHLWGFNLRTGICEGNREISVVTHEVRVDGDSVLVRLAPVRESTASVL